MEKVSIFRPSTVGLNKNQTNLVNMGVALIGIIV